MRFVEVSGGYPGCAAVCCAVIFFDNHWQQRCYCDTWLWQSQNEKVYLVCEPCFGGLVQVDLHVFTQKGLHTKRAEHEGWHFRWRFSNSPMEVACSLIAPGWRPSQFLPCQSDLIAVGVSFNCNPAISSLSWFEWNQLKPMVVASWNSFRVVFKILKIQSKMKQYS